MENIYAKLKNIINNKENVLVLELYEEINKIELYSFGKW
jgi:hypothetical protein